MRPGVELTTRSASISVLSSTLRSAGERGPRIDATVHDRSEPDGNGRGHAALSSRQLEQSVDESREPADLGQRAGHVFACRTGAVSTVSPSRFSNRSRSAASGCAQLVRGVGDEGLLGRDECLQPLRGPVERLGQLADLRRAAWHRSARRRARPRRSRRPPAPERRAAWSPARARRRLTRNTTPRTIAPDPGQHEPGAADALIDERGRVRDPQRSDRGIGVHDRHREVLQRPVQRVGVSPSAGLPAGQRGAELGPAREVAGPGAAADRSRRSARRRFRSPRPGHPCHAGSRRRPAGVGAHLRSPTHPRPGWTARARRAAPRSSDAGARTARTQSPGGSRARAARRP